MHETDCSSLAKSLDWGRTTLDYTKYRPVPPKSYYEKLIPMGVGIPNQTILDLGTGVGPLARSFAMQGCKVVGIDISEKQINMAKELAYGINNLTFIATSAEEMDFEDSYFDVATAMQCWHYFNAEITIPKLKKILKKNGLIVISNFDHLPLIEPIAFKTEQLILDYFPNWNQAGWNGEIKPSLKWAEKDFTIKAMFYYDEAIPFSKESWRGRMRASQAISAFLPIEKVIEFDMKLNILLNQYPENFTILHRISTHILEFKDKKGDEKC